MTDQRGKAVRSKNGDAEVSSTYNLAGEVLTKTDARGKTTRFQYDHAGRVVKQTNPLNQSAETDYDGLGNKVRSRDLSGQETRLTYDLAGRLLEQHSPFDGSRRSRVKHHYDPVGNLVKQQSIRGENQWRISEFTYDSGARQTDAIAQGEGGQRTHTVYDGLGNKLKVHTGLTDDPADAAVVTTYTYDSLDRPVKVRGEKGNQTDEHLTTYTRNGQKLTETARTIRGGVTQDLAIRYRYDGMGGSVNIFAQIGLESLAEVKSTGNSGIGKDTV